MQSIEWKISQEPVHFPDAVDFMQQRVEEIIKGESPEMIWILEHQPVYTAGISAKDEDLLIKTNIPIFKTNRGGKYTFHGPGIKIVYVMLNLKRIFSPAKPDVSSFVELLENWVIAILQEFGIKGEIRKGRVGIWVHQEGMEKKIAALGIKIKKWISYHGIAININPDLSSFKNIIPCGIKEFGTTSIAEVLMKKESIQFNSFINSSIDEVFKKTFPSQFLNLLK